MASQWRLRRLAWAETSDSRVAPRQIGRFLLLELTSEFVSSGTISVKRVERERHGLLHVQAALLVPAFLRVGPGELVVLLVVGSRCGGTRGGSGGATATPATLIA